MPQAPQRDPFSILAKPQPLSPEDRAGNLTRAAEMFSGYLTNFWHEVAAILGPRAGSVCYEMAIGFGFVVTRGFTLALRDEPLARRFASELTETIFDELGEALAGSDVSLNRSRYDLDVLTRYRRLESAVRHCGEPDMTHLIGRIAIEKSDAIEVTRSEAARLGDLLLYVERAVHSLFSRNAEDF